MKRVFLVVLVMALAISSLAFTTPSNAAKAKVYVIHGIPGKDLNLDNALPVDVLVNNSICLLKGFKFGEISGPVHLDPGTYNIKISPANTEAPCSNETVIGADAPFAAGENATVIAHLTEAGAPTASKYTNDTTPLARRLARLTVRHDAAAPVKLPAKMYDVTLYPAGTTTAVFGSTSLTLNARTNYFVYAVGSLANGTFTYIVHTITGKGMDR